ncbi:MAG: hypothetical protein IPM54_12015 [Polyangiaceae bacterium]|nr:hypothetical protein [Polyangiaceae bacterium]
MARKQSTVQRKRTGVLLAFGLLAGIALLSSSCQKHSLGEQCVFGCEVQVIETADGTINVCHPTREDCEEPYFCSLQTNNCEKRTPRGQPCGEECEIGLICRFDNICEELGREDKPCLRNNDCIDGLLCNYGAAPEDPDRLGRCKPLQGENGPCFWNNASSVGTGDVFGFSGCKGDFVCEPLGRTKPEDVPEGTTICGGINPCGYPGVCKRPGLAAAGAYCVEHRACSTGQCYSPPVPTGKRDDPRFLCSNNNDDCYAGAWPGTCVTKDDGLAYDACDPDQPNAKACAEPLVCTKQWGCMTPQSVGEDMPCSINSNIGPEPIVCGLGLACVQFEGSYRCL